MNGVPGDGEHDDALRRASLVLALRSMGITNHAIISAFEDVARDAFTPPIHSADAYADRLIPLACGQTMEAPSVLAQLLKAVPVSQDGLVLEIGTGSGYFSALLARLARRVITLERFRSLAENARAVLEHQRMANVDCVLADGLSGWQAAAPYHAIFVTGSVQAPPPIWLEQIAPEGRLVAPIGPPTQGQTWVCFSKDRDGSITQDIIGPAFAVPLIPGLAKAL